MSPRADPLAGWRWLALTWVLLLAAWRPAAAQEAEADITLQARYWIDTTGQATVQQVAGGAAQLVAMDRYQSLQLERGALWMRFDLPALDPSRRWFLLLTGAAFIDRASLFTRTADGWREQVTGDHVPVGRWDHPNFSPLFSVAGEAPQTVWMRIQNVPAPTSPFVQLLTAERLESKRQWTYALLGVYAGFCLLVFVVGLMHARLYGDLAFDAYCAYVAFMLLFQLAYTGAGGLFLWPEWARFNDAAPGLFMFPMAAAGIWFVREASSVRRHSRLFDRVAIAFCLFGVAFAPIYVFFTGPATFAVLNVYALVSVILSISLALWTWRKGEKYSGWLFLGFLPIHLSYPFPAMRAAGLLPDSWATQYAVLIGSAIEIPLLLYILHSRAKDFSENHARLRVLDTTDPLTGLTIVPVLRLRLRDALRRAHRSGHHCAVLLVDLANHAEIAQAEGREARDRALVVAASRLSRLVREVDTVCRVADTRFAILLEGPQSDDARRHLAQHIVARGLEPLPRMPQHLQMKFRVVSATVPDAAMALADDGHMDEMAVLRRLEQALDRLLEDPRRVVMHLDPQPAIAPGTAPTPA